MLTAVPLLVLSFALILFAAELFTNGVEWVGVRLGLGHGAVGSVLAALGTAMPETLVPIIAIVFVGSANADDVGVGAILGGPLLLSTAAFFVTGAGLLAYRGRRTHGAEMRFDSATAQRDMTFFLGAFSVEIAVSFLPFEPAKHAIAVLLLVAYGVYAFRAIASSGEAEEEEGLEPLRLHRLLARAGSPHTLLAWAQAAGALGVMIGGAYLFVHEIERISDTLGLPALALSLIVTPLATELPETFNSVIWVRQGKDTLALGNITGAMVLQSCVPAAIGVAFTDWTLSETPLVSAAITLASVGIVYFSVRTRGYLEAKQLLRAGLLWLIFVVYVGVKISV